MIDTVQVVLLIVIVLLTFLLFILGIQVYFILKELTITISKANRVLDNTEMITESVSEPMSFLSGIIMGTKAISKFLKTKSKEHN